MDIIEAATKTYEGIATRKDTHFESAVAAVTIIKKFIIKHKLILYGGAAIDFALRLHGTNIYPDNMLAVPDLDFYSYDSVAHAYELADELFAAGYKEARAIVASYMRTMRVDIALNHFLADITYIPRAIFDTLPFVIYENMRVIDPVFQKMDSHASLSYPFDNPPREVIFVRWAKDICRFNKMHKFYPTPKPKATPAKLAPTTGVAGTKHALTGFAGYAVIMHACEDFLGEPFTTGCVARALDGGRYELTFNSATAIIDLVTPDFDAAIADLSLTEPKAYASFINLRSKHIVAQQARLFSSKSRLLGIKTVTIDGVDVLTASIQQVLFFMLAEAHIAGRENPYAAACYRAYDDLLDIMNRVNARVSAEQIMALPCYPSIEVLGDINRSDSTQMNFLRVAAELKRNVVLPPVPMGYRPERARQHPTFDYNSNEAFVRDGRPLDSADTK